MSNPYRQENSRRGAGPVGLGASGRRTALGYWVPLILTVSVATIGLAAWVWGERRGDDDDDSDDDDVDEGKEHHGRREDKTPIGLDPDPDHRSGEPQGHEGSQPGDPSVMSRVQGAWRRTPSPQQIFDNASKRVAAGVAAAGAVVGGALTSIRDEGRGDFEDHSRWTEEANNREDNGAESQRTGPPNMSGALPARQPVVGKTRKTVAIVVSSVASSDEVGAAQGHISEHASILSHLPEYVETDTARIFVLIYAPGLKPRSARTGTQSRPTLSMASSYSNIGHEEAAAASDAPEEAVLATVDPQPTVDDFESPSPLFKNLCNQALALVNKETMIMPFNTVKGHVHILKHLSPDIVYMQESLTGNDGDAVHQISGWVRQVVLVIGDEGGRGGLVDSDEESALADKGEKWWQKEGVTGLGKQIDVVDGLRIGDDWRRRVSGYD